MCVSLMFKKISIRHLRTGALYTITTDLDKEKLLKISYLFGCLRKTVVYRYEVEFFLDYFLFIKSLKRLVFRYNVRLANTGNQYDCKT